MYSFVVLYIIDWNKVAVANVKLRYLRCCVETVNSVAHANLLVIALAASGRVQHPQVYTNIGKNRP